MGMIVVTEQLPFEALIKWAYAMMPCGESSVARREGHAPAYASVEVTGPQKRTFNYSSVTHDGDPFTRMLLCNRIERRCAAQGKFIPTFATRCNFGMDVSDGMIKCRVLL